MWKDGCVEGWMCGRMEGWKDGRMEGWKDGRMEEWKSGRVDGVSLSEPWIALIVLKKRVCLEEMGWKDGDGGCLNRRFKVGGVEGWKGGRMSEPRITRITRITRKRGISYHISCCTGSVMVLSEPQITSRVGTGY